MSHSILILAGIAGAAAVAVAIACVRHHLRARVRPEVSPQSPSLVRMLRSDEELRDAVHRASTFEQTAMESLHARTRRYEAMLSLAQVTDIGSRRALRADSPGGDTPHSA